MVSEYASTAPKTDLELATKFSNEQFRFEAKIKAWPAETEPPTSWKVRFKENLSMDI